MLEHEEHSTVLLNFLHSSVVLFLEAQTQQESQQLGLPAQSCRCSCPTDSAYIPLMERTVCIHVEHLDI